MASIEEIRIETRRLREEMDIATVEMMTLVSAKRVSGPEWDAASTKQHEAYEKWHAFMNAPGHPEPH
ncbi:hypothetical protein [Pseudomonas sp. MYb118]|uniref:hypothetical protein n=1 Tax=Pseudomonas sp. MYb118 TaxID=1848720 RepID=UPI0034CD94D3